MTKLLEIAQGTVVYSDIATATTVAFAKALCDYHKPQLVVPPKYTTQIPRHPGDGGSARHALVVFIWTVKADSV